MPCFQVALAHYDSLSAAFQELEYTGVYLTLDTTTLSKDPGLGELNEFLVVNTADPGTRFRAATDLATNFTHTATFTASTHLNFKDKVPFAAVFVALGHMSITLL